MKSFYKFFILGKLLFSTLIIFAQQSTWVKTIQYNGPALSQSRYDSLHVGPYEIAPTPDGNFYLLNYDDEESVQSLCFFRSNGTVNHNVVGWYQTLQYYRAYGLKATPDSGCIYIQYYNDFGGFAGETYSLIKVGGHNSGIVHTWSSNMGIGDVLSAAIPNYHNSYYCNINGYWIDYTSGDTVNLNSVVKIFSNDDFMLAYPLTFSRSDTAGNIIWSVPTDGYNLAGSNENYFFTIKDSIRRYDSHTGSLLWTRPLLANGNSCYHQSTDGLVFMNGRAIVILDSSGNLVDSNKINFTLHSPFIVHSLSDGSLITGGSFKSGDNYLNQGPKGYSPVVIKLDNTSHGEIDSTDYYYMGNADSDNSCDFADDAVVIAAAFGSNNGHPNINYPSNYRYVAYSADWLNRFPSGLNHKYCDINFDGVINRNDIIYGGMGWQDNNYNHYDTSGAIVKLLLDNYSPNLFSPFTIYVVLGSTTIPIDSIYGISLSVVGTPAVSLYITNVELYNGVLGDTATNLYYYPVMGSNGAVICRTDSQNTIVAGDTILKMTGILNNIMQSGWQPELFPMGHILSKDGYTIPMNSIPAIFSQTVGISEINNVDVNIYPSPANDFIKINSNKNDLKEVSIYDMMGKLIQHTTINNDHFEFNVESLSSGLYMFKISNGEKNYFKLIEISH